MFNLWSKKKLSSSEIQSALLKEASKYRIDPQSLTTSMGGMTKDNTDLYMRVTAERTRKQASAAFWISIIALCYPPILELIKFILG